MKKLSDYNEQQFTPEQIRIIESWRCPLCHQFRVDDIREAYPELDNEVAQQQKAELEKEGH